MSYTNIKPNIEGMERKLGSEKIEHPKKCLMVSHELKEKLKANKL